MKFGYTENCEEYICIKCLEHFSKEPLSTETPEIRKKQIEKLLSLLDQYIVQTETPPTWRNWSFYCFKTFEGWYDIPRLALSVQEKSFSLVVFESVGPSNFTKEYERLDIRFSRIYVDTYAEVKKIGEFIQRAVKFSNRGKHEDAYPVA